ncbi:type IV conjugative transfer system protein TraL, partial [Pantoea agglomerans]|nr:type IV conjugative transfer system protein TraL [Pantoea agglomerans]
MEDRESRRYYFPETLNNQKRWFGLPPEEAVILIGCGGLGFWIDMFVIMLITGGALWLL